MQRQIHYLTIGSETDATFTRAAMTTFLQRLKAELPTLNLSVAELTCPLLGEITNALNTGHLNGARDAVLDTWSIHAPRAHVTVYCPDLTHPAVRAARARLPHALWGISLSGALSLTYTPQNPFALWHESLHLLGAQDHYDSSTFQPTCRTPSCLMQYAPSQHTIGQHPFICPASATILRKTCA